MSEIGSWGSSALRNCLPETLVLVTFFAFPHLLVVLRTLQSPAGSRNEPTSMAISLSLASKTLVLALAVHVLDQHSPVPVTAHLWVTPGSSSHICGDLNSI